MVKNQNRRRSFTFNHTENSTSINAFLQSTQQSNHSEERKKKSQKLHNDAMLLSDKIDI